MKRHGHEKIIVGAVVLAIEVILVAVMLAWRDPNDPIYTDRNLWIFTGLAVFLYVMYLKLRTDETARHIIDEKFKTHSLVEALPMGILLTDDEGVIISSNERAAEILGVGEAALLGRNFPELAKPFGLPAADFIGETPLKIGDRVVGLSLKPLRGEHHQELGRLAVLQPHDRRPVTTVAAPTAPPDFEKALEILALPIPSTKDPAQAAAMTLLLGIRWSTLGLQQRIQILLNGPDAKAALSGKTDLGRAVGALGAAFKTALGGAPVQFDVPAVTGPAVPLSAEALNAVLGELLLNAFQYQTAFPLRVQMTVDANGPDMKLAVRDWGVGIARPEFPKILEDGYRGKNQTPSSAAGNGKGLSLANRILAATGGSLFVESEEGRGTRVTVILPKAP
ncbi:MAG: ATP-binding protein [Planctomycetota bacterium]